MVMTDVLVGRHAEQVNEPVEPEVPERATRRVFSRVYKLRILAEYERRSPVMRSALLRREGLYTSSISEWRRQRDEGALDAQIRRAAASESVRRRGQALACRDLRTCDVADADTHLRHRPARLLERTTDWSLRLWGYDHYHDADPAYRAPRIRLL